MDKDKKEEVFKSIGTALSDIEKRAEERRKKKEAEQQEKEGKKTFKSNRPSAVQLYGLATFGGTTTRTKTTK
jgi:hypothetical protein